MTRKIAGWCVVAMLAAAGTVAMAGDPPPRKEFNAPPLTSKWNVRAGGLLASFNTRGAFSPGGFVGGIIQLEDDLGLQEDIDTFVLYGSYRIGPRQSVDLSFNSVHRNATRTIDKTIEWKDLVFDVGAQVETVLDIDQFKARWRYDFSDSERLNAGMSAGLSTFDISASLSGTASVNGQPPVQGAASGAHLIAPIPVAGFFVDYAFSPRWILRSSLDMIRGDVGDISARVLETAITAEYYPTTLFGVGLGFTNSEISYSQKSDNEFIAVAYGVSALTGYVSFVF